MAADEFTWVMSEIVTRFQTLIGDQSLAAATCRKHINDYYCNQFAEDADVDELKGFWTQSTACSDSGEYSLAQTDLKLLKPVTCGIDRHEIDFIVDHEEFFRSYPDGEQYVTAPGLAIGTSDTKKVKHDAFTYNVSTYQYSKASSEVTLSGDTVPQNKYGAFGFKINASGTISVDAATNNSTGYDTPADAVDELDYTDSDTAYMGFITVICTGSAGFVPGTTALDGTGVTPTYTDGKWENRQEPEAITVFNGKVYARPKADDIYQLRSPRLIRPDAIDTGAPLDIKWGPAIALGAAIFYLRENTRDTQRADDLQPSFDRRIDSIRGKQIFQLTERQIERSFL